jgi:hypothetical protein
MSQGDDRKEALSSMEHAFALYISLIDCFINREFVCK